ncbi:putative DsbA family dithiol-disulfide isomerase [Rhodococcus sp. SMB37]|uniref:DsbA family oxidoreductase n=1 Tax=Rhodococcus sp. SMB37 TaxID=2512213 RepID=UPI00104B5B75|nr:DsbA family oxidoreductase [Rhodococcus sp. SMB37]TCN51192.1 putative DsbA family dithiol-disulfide isomerase [Rhodococcus sp. SMB37]
MSTPADVALPTAHIEIWSDIACPWCYIGKRRFTDALAGFPQRDRVAVTWRSYQLAPDTPAGLNKPEIDALVEMKGMPAEQVRQMFSQVSATAAQVGLDIDFDTVIAANTFDAHRLLHLAGDKRDELLEALFRAHFVGGEIVDDREALVRIAASIGLDADQIRADLDSDAAADAVRADLLEARQLGVTGVPFFVANRAVAVSGAQPEDVFLVLLERAIADADSAEPVVDPVADDADGCAGDNCVV